MVFDVEHDNGWMQITANDVDEVIDIINDKYLDHYNVDEEMIYSIECEDDEPYTFTFSNGRAFLC